MDTPKTMYAELRRYGNDKSGQLRAYQIYAPDGAPRRTGWVGPYRDKTDAENAAEDVARAGGFELEWVG